MHTNNILKIHLWYLYNFLYLIYARKASQMWISAVRVFDWLYMRE